MMPKVTFADLKDLMEQLEFDTIVVPGSHVSFVDRHSGRPFILRSYEDNDTVDPAGLAYVRSTLDAWGIFDREDFDEHMRKRTLAG
jgi:hypothetical protein